MIIAEQDLEEHEEALLKYKQSNALADLSIQTIADTTKLVILEKLLSEATAKLQSAKAEGSRETAGLKAEQAALEAALRDAKANLSAIPEKEMDIARLERDRQTSEAVYTMLRSRFEEMQISEAIQRSEVYVIDAAVVPDEPIKPRKLLNTAIAGILGLFVAVGLAFVLEYTDKRK
jgi:succinoglycan biosynthesis transport protein ExoP